MKTTNGRAPKKDEFASYYQGYISLVGDGDINNILGSQIESTLSLIRSIPGKNAKFRYSEGKWSIAEVVGHLIDTERVMAFRALAFGRGDTAEIPGMDQDQYVLNGKFDDCGLTNLADEFESLRAANISFFGKLPADCWSKGGVASGNHVTVRALAYIIAGHELHHINIFKERYLSDASFLG